MDALQHLALALVICGLALGLAGEGFDLRAIAVIVVGALLPDVDHRKTKMFKSISLVVGVGAFFLAKPAMQQRLGGFNGGIASAGVGLAAITLFWLFKPRHRGVTHSFVAAALYAALVWSLSTPFLAFTGFLAYASHLAADKEFKII